VGKRAGAWGNGANMAVIPKGLFEKSEHVTPCAVVVLVVRVFSEAPGRSKNNFPNPCSGLECCCRAACKIWCENTS
jgi:hypothetical protein